MSAGDRVPGIGRRVAMIGAAALAMALLIPLLQRASRKSDTAAGASAVTLASPAFPAKPIPGEADVFRPRSTAEVGLRWGARPRAHPRTLATYRALRAYPGAPPRVPHGLTAQELRSAACNTCHQNGGYSQRFGAYAPLTPHPEFQACLQCHAVDAALVGAPFPGPAPDSDCRQCHSPGAQPAHSAVDWRGAAWPQVRRRASSGIPPEIPHDLQMRGNCLACHAGAGAVAELRTRHPERANCRQCHVVEKADAGSYDKPLGGSRSGDDVR